MYYTTTEIGDMLNLEKTTITQAIREGKLKATRVGKAYQIEDKDVDAWVGLPICPNAVKPEVAAKELLTTMTADASVRTLIEEVRTRGDVYYTTILLRAMIDEMRSRNDAFYTALADGIESSIENARKKKALIIKTSDGSIHQKVIEQAEEHKKFYAEHGGGPSMMTEDERNQNEILFDALSPAAQEKLFAAMEAARTPSKNVHFVNDTLSLCGLQANTIPTRAKAKDWYGIGDVTCQDCLIKIAEGMM